MRLLLAIVVGVTCKAAFGQVLPRTFRRASIGLDSLSGSTEPSSNSAYPIIIANGIVYLGTDTGLDVTTDGGRTFRSQWGSDGPIGASVSAIAVEGDTIAVAVGAGEIVQDGVPIDIGGGLYASVNAGAKWTYEPQSRDSTNDTYFFPNPFSPRLDVGRIDYSVKSPGSIVTIRVYDFSMHVMKTILQNATRGQGEVRERWDGLDNQGQMVDNGVYFYSVVVNNGDPVWGKIMVVR